MYSLIITLIVLFFAFFNSRNRFVSLLMGIFLFVLYSFEYTKNGYGDYHVYEGIYKGISKGELWALLDYEPIFVFTLKLFAKIGLSFVEIKILLGFFYVFVIYKTISLYTKNVALPLALFFIFPAIFDAELIRFSLAFSFVIFGMKFIIRGKKWKDYIYFGLCVVIGSCCHVSVIFYFIFFLLLIKNKKIFYAIVFFLIIFGFGLSMTNVYSILNSLPFGDHIRSKYQTDYQSTTLGMLVFIFTNLSIILIAAITKFSIRHSKIKFSNWAGYLNDKIIDINVISLLLVIISLFTTQVQRLTHLMLLYNYIYLASVMDYRKNLKLAKFYALCCSLFLLYRMCFHGSQGTMPVFISHFTIGYFTRMFELL